MKRWLGRQVLFVLLWGVYPYFGGCCVEARGAGEGGGIMEGEGVTDGG